MASVGDAGAKRQMFYDIECVIDDCDGELGYKPLSDSDELDESAEEDEAREEGIDSSEEWEPITGRSKAKRQQYNSSSTPRRRGRPRKYPLSLTASRSFTIHPSYSPSGPRRRGRPPKDKPKTVLLPEPTLYPQIIPKTIPYSSPFLNSRPTNKFSPNATSVPLPNNIQSIKLLNPNSPPIHTSSPTSFTFSINSTHKPLTNTVPSITFASNSSPILTSNPTPIQFRPNSTHTITVNPNSSPTSHSTPISSRLISKPTQAGLLLNTNTVNKINDSLKKRHPLEEKVDSLAVIQQIPEHSTSLKLLAKRPRLSPPSPPAITPLRRRGRPRKLAPKITSNSLDEHATGLISSDEPATFSNPTAEPPAVLNPLTTFNPTIEPSASSSPTAEPATFSNPTAEPPAVLNPLTTFNPTIEPVASSSPTNEPATFCNPTVESSTTFNSTAEPATTLTLMPERVLAISHFDNSNETTTPLRRRGRPRKHASQIKSSSAEPATALTPTVEPATTFDPTIEPAASSSPTTKPATFSNPTVESSITLNSTAEPATTFNPTIVSAGSSSPTAKPATFSNTIVESSTIFNSTAEPATTSNSTAEPATTFTLMPTRLSAISHNTNETTTPLRRRGRPRNRASKINSNSGEPATKTSPTVEPAAVLNPTAEPLTSINPTIEPSASSSSTAEIAIFSNPTVESPTTVNPIAETATTSNSTAKPAATFTLMPDRLLAINNKETTPLRRRGRPRKRASKINSAEPPTALIPIAEPATFSSPTVESSTTFNLTPAGLLAISHFDNSNRTTTPLLATPLNPTATPSTPPNSISQFDKACNSNKTTIPLHGRGGPRKRTSKVSSNTLAEPERPMITTAEPVTVSNPTAEPAATVSNSSEPVIFSSPIAEPATMFNSTSNSNRTTTPLHQKGRNHTSKINSHSTVEIATTSSIAGPLAVCDIDSNSNRISSSVTRRGRPRKRAFKIISSSMAKPETSSNPPAEPVATFSPTAEPLTTSSFTADPLTSSNLMSAVPLVISDLGKDSNSGRISDSGKEDPYEDYVDCAEEQNPLMEQDSEHSTSPVSKARRVELASRPVSEPTTIPNPIVTSAAHSQHDAIPVPMLDSTPNSKHSSRRRGRPRKHFRKIGHTSKLTPEPIHNSMPSELTPTSNPNSTTSSKTTFDIDPKAKLTSAQTTSALDCPKEKVENAPQTDMWHDVTVEDEEPLLPDFCPKRPPGPQLRETTRTPLQLFQLFFTSSVIQTIVRNTNSYAKKKADVSKKLSWVPLTVNEFYSYVALVLYMGLVKADSLMNYWTKKRLYRFSYPRSIMSQMRFQSIFCNLHLCDLQEDEENDKKRGSPDYDRLLKIKPLYTDILSACRAYFHPNREISVHERLHTSKTRMGPTKPGYRLFVLADLSSGYNWNFFVYDGKNSTSPGKGIRYNSVMRLLDLKFLGNGYKLYTDTLYTSPTLYRDLLQNDILACGPLRRTFSLPEVKVSSESADRGSIRWCRQGRLLFVRWTDKREIVTCSTMHKAFAGDFIIRRVRDEDGVWNLRQIPVPPAVKDCNKYRNDEDSYNALIWYYNILYKTKKWYKTFFIHFLEMAVVNCYVLHQHLAKAQNETPLSEKVFREKLISELRRAGRGKRSSAPATRDPSNKKPSPSALSAPTERCLPQHFGSHVTSEKRQCVRCKLSGHKVKTNVWCLHCKVALCLVPSRNCFQKWHIEGHSSG
nr:mucin-2-like [Misgurnus anguillicaudatus]